MFVHTGFSSSQKVGEKRKKRGYLRPVLGLVEKLLECFSFEVGDESYNS